MELAGVANALASNKLIIRAQRTCDPAALLGKWLGNVNRRDQPIFSSDSVDNASIIIGYESLMNFNAFFHLFDGVFIL